MIIMSPYPECRKRIRWNATNMSDPLMSSYWAAVIVADFCDDISLKRFGGFNFSDRSDDNGKKLLERLEQFLSTRIKRGKRR